MNDYFPEVSTPLAYEGSESDNPLSFKYYRPEQIVAGKPMKEHLRFAVAYWHSFQGTGRDIFGADVYQRPWNRHTDPMDRAREMMAALFEFCTKMGIDYYCFHDRDMAPEGAGLTESNRNLQAMVTEALLYQEQTGVRLLWGTANLFSHPRYTHGAATNPDARVFAYAAAQVKAALDATCVLGGQNYVLWGGREGYESLLNTDMGQEQEQLACFLHMAVDYARQIGFTGQLLIEPKPKEPTKHQYDTDAATVLNFLQHYDLLDDFKLNIEANHATLAGHTFEHELTVAALAGRLGSIDINRGDPLLGWDTDQFPTDLYDTTKAMLVLLRHGGLGVGGLNFDAKLRRGSVDSLDLFYAHIGGMDCFARGLLIADKIHTDGVLDRFVSERYASFAAGIGKQIMTGEVGLAALSEFTETAGEPGIQSGRQEYFENLINNYI